MEEIEFLIIQGGWDYESINTLPVYARRFYIQKIIERFEAQKKEMEKKR